MILYETDEPAWYGTQAEAKASGHPFTKRDVPTVKADLIDWLNDNIFLAQDEQAETRLIADIQATKAGIEPMTEDTFEALPLSMQLHLAELALENARDRIKP